MTQRSGRIGVCSWSLQANGPAVLVERVRATGLDAVQLHLDPLRPDFPDSWGERETIAALAEGGVAVLSGMMTTEGEDYSSLETIRETGGIRPDGTWEANVAAAQQNAAIAERIGLTLVTLHAGFIPHNSADPERTKIVSRLRELIGIFNDRGVDVALETGQETAETLLSVLEEVPEAGVNFDPANMILYGMGDPHEALEKLGGRVSQLHVKDAVPAEVAGEWGSEVVVGAGFVDWGRFFEIVAERCSGVDILIEREAGESRVEDVRAAAEVVRARVGVRA